jgi:hypothetical protein
MQTLKPLIPLLWEQVLRLFKNTRQVPQDTQP